jgi:hypothetical protein
MDWLLGVLVLPHQLTSILPRFLASSQYETTAAGSDGDVSSVIFRQPENN